MPFDFKKEYKEFYLPPTKPTLIDVPEANYLAVRGSGDPNMPEGEYMASIGLLYGVAFTLKMSARAGHAIEGFFDYVVPPLEGFWWQDGVSGIDYTRKRDYKWISLIRLPDFIAESDFEWAKAEAERKKKTDFGKVEYMPYSEGLCVQCMHLGPYDDEPQTVALMESYMSENSLTLDINDIRYHHEIYLSDARKCAPDKRKTVIRHPVKRL